jgi:hypothetical protein
MKFGYKSIVFLFVSIVGMISCSDEEEAFATPVPDATGIFVDDRDGITYPWARYGDQEWMTDNMRFQTTEGAFRPDLTPVKPIYYDDGRNRKYYDNYGGLYDFTAANAAVPDGWRLPTDEDWNRLADRVGPYITEAIDLQFGGFYITAESYSQQPIDFYAGVYGFYWTATTDETKSENNFAFCRKIVYNKSGYEQKSIAKGHLLNVRCVRDVK